MADVSGIVSTRPTDPLELRLTHCCDLCWSSVGSPGDGHPTAVRPPDALELCVDLC